MEVEEGEEIFDSENDTDDDDTDLEEDDIGYDPTPSGSNSNYYEAVDDQEETVGGDEEEMTFFTPEQHKQQIIQLVNKKVEFKFSINYSLFPDLVPYFWATLNEYFQELMELFIISDGWRLTDFFKAAENRNLHSVFRCAYSTKGAVEARAKHFRIVFQVLLDSAKFQWLAPWKTRNTFGLSVCIKRQIGGLYLVYYLLMKQPEPPLGVLSTEKQKMHVDSDDSRSIRFFLNDINKLEDSGNGKELKKEVKLIFLKLHHQGLFEKTMLREDYSLEASSLMLTGSKTDPRLNYFGLLKDVRDKLLYLTYQGIGNTTFKDMLKVAQTLVNRHDHMRKKSRRGKQQSDLNDDNERSSSSNRKPVKPKKGPVTFQTKLRQRLEQQFLHFQKQYTVPSEMDTAFAEESTRHYNPDTKIPHSKETSQSPSPSSSKNMPKTTNAKPFRNTKLPENAFPPQRKSEWTVEEVKALKDERDLAVIAFRIVEILKFVTPANPLTTTRLINEMRVDQNAQDLIDKYASRDRSTHDKRLNTPSRLSKLSQKGKHQCFKTPETKYWMDYISGSKKNPNTPSVSQMLEKLRTHDVVATEPALVFKPSEHPDTSTFIDGDEEFEFDDKNRDERNRALLPLPIQETLQNEIAAPSGAGQLAITWTASNTRPCDMPDLNTYWDEEPAIPATSFGDDPPHLSPEADPLQITPADYMSSSNPSLSEERNTSFSESESDISSLNQSPAQKKSWFILATGDEPHRTLLPTKKSELNTNSSGLCMPSLSNLSLSPTKTLQQFQPEMQTSIPHIEPDHPTLAPTPDQKKKVRGPRKKPSSGPLRRGPQRNSKKVT